MKDLIEKLKIEMDELGETHGFNPRYNELDKMADNPSKLMAYGRYLQLMELIEQLPQQSAEGLIDRNRILEDFFNKISFEIEEGNMEYYHLASFCNDCDESLRNVSTTPSTEWVDRDKACEHVGKLAMVYNHEGYPVNGEIWESPFDGFAILDRATGFYIAIPPSGFFILPQPPAEEE